MVMTKSQAYDILGCDVDTSNEEIRASYKRLALKWHPDKHSDSSEATEKFQEISEAYKRLTSTVDDDNITISMGDMFDLFAHIFFTHRRYYRPNVHPTFIHSDDDEDDDDDDDDDVPNGDCHRMGSTDSSEENYGEYTERNTIYVGFHTKGRKKYTDLARSTLNTQKKSKKNAQIYSSLTEAEALKNAQELINEEERKKKKAEKRREKKKRNRAKRKEKDKGEKPADNNVVVESEEESRDEAKKQTKSKNSKDLEDSPHEEASWDTSSAFFANAARRGPGPSTASEVTSSVNVMTETSTQQYNSTKNDRHRRAEDGEELAPIVIRSRELAVEGNNLANTGKYEEAIEYFTKAINLHNQDFRFFGNRSYCYDRLGEYDKALEDAEVTISLAPVWPKGYFRKGRALAGLNQHSAAETAYSHVLKLDKHCDDAKFELINVRAQQLMDMGFPSAESEQAVRLYGTVQAALDALLAGKVKSSTTSQEETYISEEETDENEFASKYRNDDACSLWVGNVDPRFVTDRQLTQLFSKCGAVDFIRILPSSHCAFVNYENSDSAAKALVQLQGYLIGGQNLKLRYPNHDKCPKSVDVGAGLANSEECYFWRTTGCVYGDKCRFLHVPNHKGVDLSKVEQKYGRPKPVKKGW